MKEKWNRLVYLFKSLSIRVKLSVIISFLVLTSLGLLTWISLGIFENDISNMVTVMNSRTTKLLSEKVESELGLHKKNLALIDKIQSAGKRGDLKLIRESFLNNESEMTFVAGFLVENSRINPEPEYSVINSQFSSDVKLDNRAVLKKILKNNEWLSRSTRGEEIVRNFSQETGKPIILFISPIKRESGSVRELMIALVKMEALNEVFASQSARGAPGGSTLYASFMIDGDGRAVVHPSGDKVLTSESMNEHPAVKKVFELNTRNAVIRYKTSDGAEFGAFQKLNIGGLVVVTTINEDLALEGVSIARTRSLLISLLIISIAILFIYFFSKTISKPLKDLVLASDQISEGHYQTELKKDSEDEIGELTDAFVHMAEGLEEREKLKGAFGKFVNPEIAQMILKGDLALIGESKNVAVFFSDIRSFTAISENLEPAEVVGFLNEYFTLMVDIIHKSNGVVDKFIGDAIMAVWGAPVSKGNDIENAVSAAVQMRKALLKFNTGRGSAKKPIIKIGSGINFGPVLAGQIGSNDRLEYTVIGDAVNLASRLEALNKPYGTDIIIPEHVFDDIKGTFNCVSLGSIKVKGKTKPIKIYCVLGRKDDSDAPSNLAELRKILGTSLDKASLSKKGSEKKYEILKE
ncbi:MAG: adenylate/guanylate cyclase domain-containing protein [Leptospiraceae bacterium]|nr:adenylate/guanylate cyclase domain-containing protein [Leptospiraceae bacterium]